jgi:hypothetical protein
VNAIITSSVFAFVMDSMSENDAADDWVVNVNKAVAAKPNRKRAVMSVIKGNTDRFVDQGD